MGYNVIENHTTARDMRHHTEYIYLSLLKAGYHTSLNCLKEIYYDTRCVTKLCSPGRTRQSCERNYIQ